MTLRPLLITSRQSAGGAIGDGAVAATTITDGAMVTATAVIGVGAAADGGVGKLTGPSWQR